MKKKILSLILTVCTLAGCANNASPAQSVQTGTALVSGTPLFEKPVVIPSVLTDQTGYDTGAEKLVLFQGDALPAEYEIRRVDDGTTVFTGAVTPFPEDTVTEGDPAYYGVFTDFQTAGEYYIFAEGIGESYSFRIGPQIDETMLDEALSSFRGRCCGVDCHTEQVRRSDDPSLTIDVSGGWHTDLAGSRDTVRVANAMCAMLLSYEINTARFSEDTDILEEVRTGAEWLLKLQAADNRFFAGVDASGEEAVVSEPTGEAAIAAACALSKFAFHYEERDAEFAKRALDTAVSAYTAYSKGKTPGSDAGAFFAAAELYRLTGEKKYETTLSAMFQRGDFERVFLQEDDVFFGGVTYIATKQPVNVAVCEQIMELLRVRSEQIATAANRSVFRVTDAKISAEDVTAIDRMLKDMRTLAVTDHIIYNHEYTTVIENHVHFLRGRNPLAVNFVDGTTEHTFSDMGWTGVLDDPLRAALFLLMVSML